MKTYISLIRYTEKGAATIKKSTERAESFDKAAEAAGVEIVAQYWTMGSCDGVLIVRSEDENKALHWLTELVSYGNVTTETMRGFEAEEFQQILTNAS